MSKKKKETKEVSVDELKEQLVETKTKLSDARKEMNAFCKENKLKKAKDHSDHKDKKIATAYKKLQKAIEKLEAERDALQEKFKASKPKAERNTKYDYPEGMTADDRKKFRQETRVKAKRAGVDVDEYLSDPAKYDAIIKENKEKKAASKKPAAKKEKAEKAEKKEKKAKKDKAPKGEKEDKPKKKKKANKKSKND